MRQNCFSSCQYSDCKMKDSCFRYNDENAIVSFKAYYDEEDGKCEWFIEKECDAIEQ